MGNLLDMQSVSRTKQNLTECHVKEALERDKGSNARLVSWSLEDFTEKGDHIAGVVTCVNVKYKIGEKEREVTYIAKLNPSQPMKALRDMVSHGSKKELMFYKDLLPELNAELKALGLDPLHTPECLHENLEPEKQLLLLKDLRPKGFQKFNPRRCLDVAHTKLILQELARFHASSYLLQIRLGRENFNMKYRFLEKEWYEATDDALAFFKTLWDGNIENAIAVLKSLDGDVRAIKWLKTIKPDVYSILGDLMGKDSVFTTLCHADCVSTNTLFRYNDDGHPTEVVLLDFQIIRQATLVTDLHLLLYISLYGSDRKNNLEEFLRTYFTSFKNVIDASNRSMPFSFLELCKEFKSKMAFGVIWALPVIPMFAGGGELAEISKEKEGNNDSEGALGGNTIRLDFKLEGKDAELRARFLPIFDELIEEGIIS